MISKKYNCNSLFPLFVSRLTIFVFLSFTFAILLFISPSLLAQDGSLDLTFGTNGIASSGINPSFFSSLDLALQSDGKIVVASDAHNGSNYDFAVMRFNSDGTLDNQFGSSGTLLTPISASNDNGSSTAIQSDGKIVVAGGSNNDFALVRYKTDGTLDNLFGTNGIVTTDLNSSQDMGNSVAIQSDGKIVLVGETFIGGVYQFAVARYNIDGSLDNTFNLNGKLALQIGTYAKALDVVIQVDGKIVICGYSSNSNFDCTVIRLNGDGTLDNTFDSDGIVTTDILSDNDYATSLDIQTDGKIVISGFTYGTTANLVVVRYNSDGSLDNTFDSDGVVTIEVSPGLDKGRSLQIQSDGKIVIAGGATPTGSNGNDFSVIKFNPDGTLDDTFDNDGIVTTDVSGSDEGFSLAIQQDGKYIVAGKTGSGIKVARYNNSINPTDVAIDQRISTGLTFHSIAVNNAGQVFTWGFNGPGALGNGTNVDVNIPTIISNSGILTGKHLVGAATGGGYEENGLETGQGHSLVFDSDGKVYSWGWNLNGQLGNGSNTDSNIPVTVSGIPPEKTIISVAGGAHHSMALASDGTIYTWGNGAVGQLGNGYYANSNVPVAVSTDGVLAGKFIVSIAAGAYHCMALASDGTLYAWGNNSIGQLGDGTNNQSNVPVAVLMSGALLGQKIVSFAAGLYHTVVATNEGKVFTWGYNNKGQLGNGTNTNTNVPTSVYSNGVIAGKNIVSVASGSYHCIVLADDGSIYSWGLNTVSQLGSSLYSSDQNVPIAVYLDGELSGKNITAISSSAHHSFAISSDGLVYAWGYNANGQLGIGTNSTQYGVPTLVNMNPLTLESTSTQQVTSTSGTTSLNFSDSNIGIELDASSTGSVTVSKIASKPQVGNFALSGANNTIAKYWLVSSSGISFGNGSISVPLSEIPPGLDPNNLIWLKRENSSGDWITIGGLIVGSNFVSEIPFNSFSEFTMAYLNASLNLKTFLEGPFNSTNMNADLDLSVQLTQPYSPPIHDGTESVLADIFTTHTDIVDWVVVELRTGTTADTKKASRAAFLKADGSIVDLDGTSDVTFEGLDPEITSYYIVVHHRNHLPVMSATAVSIN